MIVGIGNDLVYAIRFKEIIEKKKEPILKRLFTEDELEYAFKKKSSHTTLAGIFAVKEALFKALGTGFTTGVSWHDVTVFHEKNGRPYILLTGKAKIISESLNIEKFHVTITHDADLSFATVILES